MTILCIKVTVVTYLTLQALKSRSQKHSRKVDLVQILLITNVAIVSQLIARNLCVMSLCVSVDVWSRANRYYCPVCFRVFLVGLLFKLYQLLGL